LAGRGRRDIATCSDWVRGTLHPVSIWTVPLTPTFSPQAGRGSPTERAATLCVNFSGMSFQLVLGGSCPHALEERLDRRIVLGDVAAAPFHHGAHLPPL